MLLLTTLAACGGGGGKDSSIVNGDTPLVLPPGGSTSITGTLTTDGITLRSASWTIAGGAAGAPLPLQLSNDDCAIAVKSGVEPANGGGSSRWQCTLGVTAPLDMPKDTTYTLALTGVDKNGGSQSVTRQLTVTRNAALDPALYAAAAGPAQSANSGDLVNLSCDAPNADWYRWRTVEAGAQIALVPPTGGRASFVAPAVAAPTPLQLACDMSVAGRVFTSTKTVTLKPPGRPYMVTSISGPGGLLAGTSAPLAADTTWYGADGRPTVGSTPSYAWSFVNDVGPTGMTLSSRAGEFSVLSAATTVQAGYATVKVLATDGSGASSAALFAVPVDPTEPPSKDNASSSSSSKFIPPSISPATQQVKSGEAVTIKVTAGDSFQYTAWTVVSGPTIIPPNTRGATLTFTAPKVTQPITVTLRAAVGYYPIVGANAPMVLLDSQVTITP